MFSLADLYCPITGQIFSHPVVASDGFTYEEEALEQWLKKKDSSPLTRETMKKEYYQSKFMEKIISQYISKNPHMDKEVYKPVLISSDIHFIKNNINRFNIVNLENLESIQFLSLVQLFENEILIQIIDKVDDIEKTYEDNWKLVHYICKCGNSEIIKYIIDKGVDLECQTLKKTRPIHIICMRNLPDIIHYMVNKDVNIECQTINGIRPIHYICKYGTLEMIKFVIDLNIDFSCSTNAGKYPYDFLLENTNNTLLILKYYLDSLKKN